MSIVINNYKPWQQTSRSARPDSRLAPAADGAHSEDPDTNRAELRRFQLTRRGRLVWLEIAKSGRRYQDLLHLWGRPS